MNRNLIRALWSILLCLAVLAPRSFSQALGWFVTTANYRCVLEKAGDSSWPADVAYAYVYPVGLDPRQCVVTVTTDAGQQVGSQILWSAPGQPLTIRFDASSHQTRYYAYLSTQALSFMTPWTPPEAGVLLEVRRSPGGPNDTVADVKKMWSAARQIDGRGFVPNIFLGINPFGPNDDFVALFWGRFLVPKDGEYHFATTSDDASVVMVDGKVVASWCGGHTAEPRAYTAHAGKVKLMAGPHTIEYLWQQGNGGLSAVVAWKQSGADRYVVMPKEAFVPVAKFDVASVETSPMAPSFTAFDWQTVNHSLVENLALVECQFRVLNVRSNVTYQWTFDDGETMRGPVVTNLFLRPGVRSVRLRADQFQITQPVEIEPRWEQLAEWSNETFARERRQIRQLDLTKLPVDDLVNLLRLADAIEDGKLMVYAGPICLKRAGEFTGKQADVFYALGGYFQEPDTRRYDEAAQALRAGLERKSDDANLTGRIKLRLSRLLLDTFGKVDETAALLEGMNADALNDEQRRMLAILRADVLLARGDIDGARAKFTAIRRLGELDRSRYSVQRQARLESARALMAKGELAAAEETVRLVEWEAPAERLAPEFSLVLAQIYQTRQEWARALLRCQRVLFLTENDNLRAEVLFNLVEIQRAMKLDQLADKNLTELLTKHPYSEFAARAKERWPKPK